LAVVIVAPFLSREFSAAGSARRWRDDHGTGLAACGWRRVNCGWRAAVRGARHRPVDRGASGDRPKRPWAGRDDAGTVVPASGW